MIARKQSNRITFLHKPTMMMLGFALMWSTVAEAGVILSSSDNLIAKDASAAMSVDVTGQEDSKHQLVQNSGFGSEMTAPSAFEGSELPSAAQIVQWLVAPSQTGERMKLRRDLDRPLRIPIELLKIPIATAGSIFT